MKKYFLDLFEYNNWANDRIILKLHGLNNDFKGPEPLKILSHIISAQDTWLERIKGTKTYNIFLWEEYSIQEIEVLSINSHRGWIKFISKMSEKKFDNECTYKNSEGDENSKSYQDIFQHIINHSSYHRGQINQTFRINNIEPVVTDFIYYC
jgi:uncharacterized damage-inducible protein DinB